MKHPKRGRVFSGVLGALLAAVWLAPASANQRGGATMVSTSKIMTFVNATDLKRARAFYEGTLGLRLVAEEGFALMLDSNGTLVRISKVGKASPPPGTALGWEVPDIRAAITELAGKGITFITLPGFKQDDLGVWTASDRTQVAWFRDPDDNILSLTQFPRR